MHHQRFLQNPASFGLNLLLLVKKSCLDQLGSSNCSIQKLGGETEAALVQIQVFSRPFSIFPGIPLASWPFSPTLAQCPHTGGWASCAFWVFFFLSSRGFGCPEGFPELCQSLFLPHPPGMDQMINPEWDFH